MSSLTAGATPAYRAHGFDVIELLILLLVLKYSSPSDRAERALHVIELRVQRQNVADEAGF